MGFFDIGVMNSNCSHSSEFFRGLRCVWFLLCVFCVSENSFAQSHTSRFLEPGSVVVFSMVPENVTAEIIKGISQVTGRTSVVYMKKVKTAEDAVTVVKRLRESSQLPQVFVCLGTKLSQAVKRELPDGTPPVVSLLSSKPKGDLFLNSSGIVLRYSSERTLGVLKELIPSVKKIGVLISSGASGRFSRELLHSIEKEFGFSLVLHEIADSADVAPGLASLIKDVDAIWLVQDRLVLKPDNVRYILERLSGQENLC